MIDHVLKYFPHLSKDQISQFEALGVLYQEWNDKINVISRKDIENLYVNHILHSLAIAKIISFKPGSHILDVGTGGGFPGIPLAILFPEVRFHLVDSIAKKIKVVTEVSSAIRLQNIRAEQQRVEELDAKYDFVVSRGVTTLKQLYGWTRKSFLKTSSHEIPNGILALKGGDSLIDEITEMGTHHVKTWLISDFFTEEFFLTKKVVYLKV
jgi:16S rRNA (guanine527-N7)-methyltransferase